MRAIGSCLLGISLAALAIMQPLPAAHAQSGVGGCTLERVGNPSREVLRCPNGVSIIAERATRFEIRDRDGNGSADAATLNRRALLLEVPSGASPNGFQVITPQAIAAVRGTTWAVDVAGGKTSVFVVNGSVSVQRPAAGEGVVLGAGEGVDVEAGTGPLTVKRWPAARVSALLARFGQ
jgi:hypothetical protein